MKIMCKVGVFNEDVQALQQERVSIYRIYNPIKSQGVPVDLSVSLAFAAQIGGVDLLRPVDRLFWKKG
jgi:hypothetical protein